MIRSFLFLFLAGVLVLAGCQKSGPVPVAGKVKFSDGGVPQGEISEIVFEPEELGSGNENVKGASGKIQPDGSFTITTLNPGDGAYPGKYKVTLKVFESYVTQKSLVDAKYVRKASTPLAAEVPPGGKRDFDFVVEKAVPR